jgi:hypothetical protein
MLTLVSQWTRFFWELLPSCLAYNNGRVPGRVHVPGSLLFLESALLEGNVNRRGSRRSETHIHVRHIMDLKVFPIRVPWNLQSGRTLIPFIRSFSGMVQKLHCDVGALKFESNDLENWQLWTTANGANAAVL